MRPIQSFCEPVSVPPERFWIRDASVELPEICETLVGWLRRQSDTDLQRLNLLRVNIKEREFYPRVVLGEFLQSQIEAIGTQMESLSRGMEAKSAAMQRARSS